MNTIVTGLFPNRRRAMLAAKNLMHAGFQPAEVRLVNAKTPGRHEFIDEMAADTKRSVILGVSFGAFGGVVAGAALAGVFGLVQATVVGGLAIAVGGAVLGWLVGRATTTQVRDELEHQIDGGMVLVSVSTDSAHGPEAVDLLAGIGDGTMVSTAATFTAGVVPARRSPTVRRGATVRRGGRAAHDR